MLFLGNIQPELQLQVRRSCEGAEFAGLDSMNFWLDSARDALKAAIAEVDCLLLNDAEIRELTGEPNLARAARAAMEMGPKVIVAKRGEYGAALFCGEEFFAIPGFMLEDVRDPTGAGDTFAGGFRLPRQPAAAGDSVSTMVFCARRWPTLVWRRSTSRASAPRRVSPPARRSTIACGSSAGSRTSTRIPPLLRSRAALRPGRGRAGCGGRVLLDAAVVAHAEPASRAPSGSGPRAACGSRSVDPRWQLAVLTLEGGDAARERAW
jgi:hypothetical protein